MADHIVAQIRDELQRVQRILLVSHLRPDGDAIGSLLGLGLALQAAGKDVQLVLADGLPVGYRQLPGSEQVNVKAEGSFDYIIVLDCSELMRVGNVIQNYPTPDLNIDHHVTNTKFARINFVQTEAVATAEIIAVNLVGFGLSLTKPVAEGLLTGMITDTIGFRTSNMNAQALKVAATLIEAGANISELYHNALVKRSFVAARLWGIGLSRLQREDGIVWTALSRADCKEIGYPGFDDADLVNVLSAIDEAQIALIFIEQPNGRVKISWRVNIQAGAALDVSQVALQFGGGGHRAAAGAEIDGPFDVARERVLLATRLILENH
jgi:phosphoesterase RecJ-like protein